MSTTEKVLTGLAILCAGGLFPALALARRRLVTLPLIPLAGTVVASLAVTFMAAFGWSVSGWYLTLSALGAVTVAVCWWRVPSARPWAATDRGERNVPRWVNVAAVVCGVVVTALCLTILRAQITGFDTRSIWLIHPLWYLQGRATTLATLRNPVYSFGHPPYPPLIGGSVALTWSAAGVNSPRLGIVTITLLNALTLFAASTAMVELAIRLALTTDHARARRRVRWAGVFAASGVIVITFAVARTYFSGGYADVLWSVAAVGAVAYGLVLPIDGPNLGAAAILDSIAGLTKLEGTLTSVVIALLVATRVARCYRTSGDRRALVRAGSFLVGVLAVVGVWPVLIRLLHAHPDVPYGGRRRGTDLSRLTASLHEVFHVTGIHVAFIAAGIVIALASAYALRSRRTSAGVGNDLWAWIAIGVELVIVLGAYVIGPGNVTSWVKVSALRTTTFPVLGAFWIVVSWALIAWCDLSHTVRLAPQDPHLEGASPGQLGD